MRVKSFDESVISHADKNSSSTSASNDDVRHEKSFESFLFQRNLKLYKLKRSSLFNALADQIYFKEENSDRVEQECISYWQKNTARFGSIPEASSPDLYLKLLTIAAELYSRNIIVYRIDGEVIEFKSPIVDSIEDVITISQHSMHEFHSLLNKMNHGPRKVREIITAFEQGLSITDRQESYNSLNFESSHPTEEINSFDGLQMNVQLTFENASTEDIADMHDDHSSISSVAPQAGGLVAKVARTNYHSPAMLRKHDTFKPTQFARRGSVQAASDMESSSSKEDFSTDFSTEVAEVQYCELQE